MKSTLRSMLAVVAVHFLSIMSIPDARAQWYTETIEVTASVWNQTMLEGGGGGGGTMQEGGLVPASNPDT
jgi:hypothetical protein